MAGNFNDPCAGPEHSGVQLITNGTKAEEEKKYGCSQSIVVPGRGGSSTQPGQSGSIQQSGGNASVPVQHPVQEEDPNTDETARLIPGQTPVVREETRGRLKHFCAKYGKFITACSAFIIIVFGGIIAVWIGTLIVHNQVNHVAIVYPGSAVEVISSSYFWHDKVYIKAETSQDDVRLIEGITQNEDIEAQIYFGSDCGSRVGENTTQFSTQRYLNFSIPTVIENLDGVYLLQQSQVHFVASVSQDSNLSYPIKLCRFNSEEAVIALTNARDTKSLDRAERQGKCFDIRNSSSSGFGVVNTTINDEIPANGYYFYAISTLSLRNRSVSIYFLYNLYAMYYNQSDFELKECTINVGETGCEFKGLTLVKSGNLKMDTFCFLTYIAIPPTQKITKYTFTAIISAPIGIIVVLTSTTLVFVVVFISTLLICHLYIIRYIHENYRNRVEL